MRFPMIRNPLRSLRIIRSAPSPPDELRRYANSVHHAVLQNSDFEQARSELRKAAEPLAASVTQHTAKQPTGKAENRQE